MTVQEAKILINMILEEATSDEHAVSYVTGCQKEEFKIAIKCMEGLEQYRALGTVEELKEAREKQVAKKVQKLESKILIADGWQYQCPKCKCAVGINQHAEEQTQEDEYCPTCGQALKWGEEDD